MANSNQTRFIFSILMTLIGALLALICFFQPWVAAQITIKKFSYSGFQLVKDSLALLTIPVISLLSVLSSFLLLLKKQPKYRIFNIVLGLLGVVFMILVMTQIDNTLFDWVEKAVRLHYKYGLYGVLIGFIILTIGSILGKIE